MSIEYAPEIILCDIRASHNILFKYHLYAIHGISFNYTQFSRLYLADYSLVYLRVAVQANISQELLIIADCRRNQSIDIGKNVCVENSQLKRRN